MDQLARSIRAVNTRKGISANNAMAIFTLQSATANDTQSGAIGPVPNRGSISDAQLTSVAGWIKLNAPEKATEKLSLIHI